MSVVRGPTGTAYELCAVEINDRSLLASSSEEDAYIRLWDAATGEGVAALEGHTGDAVLALCVLDAAGQQLLASGADDHTIRGEEKTIRLWDPLTGEAAGILTGHTDRVRALCSFSVDGRTLLAIAGSDGEVRLWDVRAGATVSTLKGHSGPVNAVSAVDFNGRGLLATTSTDRTVRPWDPVSLSPVTEIPIRHQKVEVRLALYWGVDKFFSEVSHASCATVGAGRRRH
ncbi:hypothetical protein [Streptomyces sp. S186]|uniref:hypothetical protein n=1 Tax=Streptomyces sp. S186 TaxID=3434395 RepID=UPI003F68058B